jgi:uncharacterized integral membrane protein
MRFIRLIIFTLIIIIGIVFIVENLEVLTNTVQLKLDLYVALAQTPGIPLWVLVLFSFFLGVFLAALYGLYDLIRQRQTNRKLRHNLEILSQELKRAGTSAEAAAASPAPAPAPKPK